MSKKTGYPSNDKPWLKYYSEKNINNPLPKCTIYEYMYENNKAYPSDIAINYLGREITYRELFNKIDMAAAAFIKLGVQEKEIVTIALPSIPEALYCVYALNKIGAIANMIHPLAGKDETLYYINEVQSRIVVIFDGAFEAIADIISMSVAEKVIVVSPRNSLPLIQKLGYSIKVKKPTFKSTIFQTWNSFIKNGRCITVGTRSKDCHEIAIISHTGGTTGEPKAVMCSNLSCNAIMWQILCGFDCKRQECSLNVLPPFINYSLLESIMAMLTVGFKVVLLPKYEPASFARYVKKYRPNQILSIPPYWEALLNIKNIEKVDMSCFKHLYSGGDKLDPNVEDRINSLIKQCGSNARLYNCVGSTEMMAGATIIYDNCYVPGSVGIPLVKVNCKIVSPGSDEELTYESEGEICFSGETMMSGYYNNPAATNDVIKLHKDGKKWFHTGDLGYINKDGIIFITGRIKRILVTKGRDGNPTKMFPDRIETILYSHPSVALCCVIGIPDKERVNYPKAYVVLKNNSNNDTIKQEILSICHKNLPEYAVPEEIEFLDDMPRTSRGKIDYRSLENKENMPIK